MDADFVMDVIRWISGHDLSGLLSKEEEIVMYAIGQGFRLEIPKHVDVPTAHAALVNGYPKIESVKEKIKVPRNVAERLLKTNLLHRLSENDEGQRSGWRFCGLNGEAADYYCAQI